MSVVLPPHLLERLHRKADAARWQVTPARFGEALAASACHMFGDRTPAAGEAERYVTSLHLADLALACACADGHDAAWEHFILEQRQVLYRAAAALDASGGARDLADAIYADLFGVPKDGGERRSLFRYFHGRSSLSTWLRAILAQRHVDRLRSGRRLDPLPEDESPAAIAAPSREPDPDHEPRLVLMQRALGRAIAALAPNDRLRLACYYTRDLTLAQTGKLLGEHEATVSRQLARARREIRAEVERLLKAEGLTEAAIADSFAAVAADAGPLDLQELLGPADDRKKPAPDRSKDENRKRP